MFKSIKRFFHNLFWKEKRVVSIPKPTRESTHPFAINDNKFFPVVGEEDRCSNNVQEEGLAASSFEASKRLEDAIKRGDPTEIHYAKLNKVLADGRACGTKLTPEEVRAILGDANNLTYHLDNEAYETSLRQPKDDLISPAQAAYDMAAALKGSALTQEEKDELDKELPHILSGNFALTGDLPDTFKGWASQDKNSQLIGRMSSDRLYQNRKRQLLEVEGLERTPYNRPVPSEDTLTISPILEDEAGDETYALKATPMMSQLEEFHEPNRGLTRGQLHILTAHTDPSKSVFHSGNSLQNEVNHLITIDPTKFCSEDHAEVDMVVKKLGDEVDCRITKVKVVKRRLKPLSKNETSKMSKRRVKKESKKVIEVNRGKHRG